MSMVRASEIEVGIRGQLITVRGKEPPADSSRYGSEAELSVDLPLARELYRLLGALIPLAEQATPPTDITALRDEGGC